MPDFPDMEVVEVGGKRYLICEVDPKEERQLGSDENWGLCDAEACVIVYLAGLGDDTKRVVVMHELLHAVDWATSTAEVRLKEEQVERLAGPLLGALRSAPALVGWLVE